MPLSIHDNEKIFKQTGTLMKFWYKFYVMCKFILH